MTAIQYVQYVLDANWETSISGRPNDVPKPPIDMEKSQSKIDLRTADHINVVDGGSLSIEPKSLGWQEEGKEILVSIDIRSADRRVDGTKVDGRYRMFGERGAGTLSPNESPRWGGLVGEARRIISAKRTGDQEFDLVNGYEINDISEQSGHGHYRVVIEVRLEQIAATIDTST